MALDHFPKWTFIHNFLINLADQDAQALEQYNHSSWLGISVFLEYCIIIAVTTLDRVGLYYLLFGF